jgi:hypothetical protein
VAREQDRPDVSRRRAQWRKYQGRIAPARLVFIDETWAKTNMTRTRGWAQRGKRLVDKVPICGDHDDWNFGARRFRRSNSSPSTPGMLMSEKINMSVAPVDSVVICRAA